jgi:hypothetical protein
MTKFQLFPYLIAFYPIAKLAFDLHKDHFAKLRELHTQIPGLVIWLNIGAMGVFTCLLLLAWNYQLAPNYFVMANSSTSIPSYHPNFAAIAFFLIGLLLCGLQIFYQNNAVIRRFICTHDLLLFSFIQAGYAVAVLTALLVLPNLEGPSYMLANFKVAYLRQFEARQVGGLLGLMDIFVHHWKLFLVFYPSLLIATGSALGLVVALGFLAPDASERIKCLRMAGWGALAGAAFIFGIVFYRFYVRDILWHETLLTFMAALLLSVAASQMETWRKRGHVAEIIIAGPLMLLMATNVASLPTVAAKTDLNFNVYGWSPEQEFRTVYAGNQLLYETILKHRFPDPRLEPTSAAGIALRHAVEWNRIRQIAEFVLPYNYIPLAKIGVFVSDGLFRHGDEKFAEVPAMLKGGIWIELQDLPERSRGTINPDLVSGPSEAFDKIIAKPSHGRRAVIPRPDLAVVVFTPKSNAATACALKVSVLKAGSPVEFCGEVVQKYTDLDAADDPRTFVVVQLKYGL